MKEGLPVGVVERHAAHAEVVDPHGLVEYSEAAQRNLETAQSLTAALVRRARECLEGELLLDDGEGNQKVDYQAAVSFTRAAFAGIDLESRLRQRRVEIALKLHAAKPRGEEDLPPVPGHRDSNSLRLLEEEVASDLEATGRAPRREASRQGRGG